MKPATPPVRRDASRLSKTHISQAVHASSKSLWLLASLILLVSLAAVFAFSRQSVAVLLDGERTVVHSSARTVAGVLNDAKIQLKAGDRVSPPLAEAPGPEGIIVQRAGASGVTLSPQQLARTAGSDTLADALSGAGLALSPNDKLSAFGRTFSPDHPVGALTQQEQRDGPSSRNGSRLEAQAAPISITITRAVNLHVHDAGLTTTIETTAANLQDALHNAGIKIYDADLVRPPLSTAVVPEQHVFIQRAKAVTVSSDDPELTPGGTLSTRSRQATVGGLLEEQRLAVTARDRIDPALSAPLRHGAEVNIKRFREVSIAVDGETINTRSKRTTVAELLADEGIKLGKHDVVEPALDSLIEQEMEVGIARFRGVVLKIDGREIEKVAASETVGDLLEEAGVVMGHLDIVEPSPDTPLSEGLEVVVTRLYGVTIKADGAAWETITRRNTVREVIRDEELALDDDDEIYPEMDAGIEDGSVIRIVRVRQGIVEEEVAIPFERAGDEPDAEMEAGEEYYTGGEPGLLYRRVHVVYRDGEESLRETVESKVLRDPVPQVRHYGTKVTRKYVDTPLGPRYYSRVVRCYATYYHDSTSSKLPGDPTWGITRTGTRTRPGTVAVDPDVIPLWSELYITDYGFGTALDTGGAVVGNLIDIWMPEGESWWVPHYVDVYILE